MFIYYFPTISFQVDSHQSIKPPRILHCGKKNVIHMEGWADIDEKPWAGYVSPIYPPQHPFLCVTSQHLGFT